MSQADGNQEHSIKFISWGKEGEMKNEKYVKRVMEFHLLFYKLLSMLAHHES